MISHLRGRTLKNGNNGMSKKGMFHIKNKKEI